METIRHLVEGLNRDWRQVLASYDELATDDFVWQGGATGIGGPEAGAEYAGREGFARYWSEIEDVWSSLSFEMDEIRAVGEHVVIGLGHPHAKGNQSGIGFDSELGLVWLMRDGRVAGGRSLLSHADAESEAERLAREAASA